MKIEHQGAGTYTYERTEPNCDFCIRFGLKQVKHEAAPVAIKKEKFVSVLFPSRKQEMAYNHKLKRSKHIIDQVQIKASRMKFRIKGLR